MTKQQKSILIQIVACVAFMLQPILLPSQPIDNPDNLLSKEMLFNYLGNALIILFFYLNYYCLIPRLLFQNKDLLYSLSVIAGLIFILLLPWLIFGYQGPPFNMPPIAKGHFHPHNTTGLFSKFQLYFTSIDHQVFLYIGIVFFSTFWREKMKNKMIENEKLQAELSHLKLQIHPHFLFNTLNSIYAFAIKKDDKTADTILKLSDFMRYLLQESYQNEVVLDKEIQYITNYIDLQKSRLRDSIALSYSTNGNFSEKKIAPLLLFTFVENAFKYGVNPDENSIIKIALTLVEEELILTVFNHIVAVKNIESTNIGIQNTKDRLQLYYPNRHTLSIVNDAQTFEVILKIKL